MWAFSSRHGFSGFWCIFFPFTPLSGSRNRPTKTTKKTCACYRIDPCQRPFRTCGWDPRHPLPRPFQVLLLTVRCCENGADGATAVLFLTAVEYIVLFPSIYPSIHQSIINHEQSVACLVHVRHRIPSASPWTPYSWAGVRDGQQRQRLA